MSLKGRGQVCGLKRSVDPPPVEEKVGVGYKGCVEVVGWRFTG